MVDMSLIMAWCWELEQTVQVLGIRSPGAPTMVPLQAAGRMGPGPSRDCRTVVPSGRWSGRRRAGIPVGMLDADYVDTVEEKSVLAIRPKPAFRPIFEVATTRGGSGIVLINETPPDPEGPEAESLCSWWRRGRVELPVQKAP